MTALLARVFVNAGAAGVKQMRSEAPFRGAWLWVCFMEVVGRRHRLEVELLPGSTCLEGGFCPSFTREVQCVRHFAESIYRNFSKLRQFPNVLHYINPCKGVHRNRDS